jgi:hypothetical protein
MGGAQSRIKRDTKKKEKRKEKKKKDIKVKWLAPSAAIFVVSAEAAVRTDDDD